MTTRTGLLFVLVAGLALANAALQSVLAQPRTTQGTTGLDPNGTVVVENHEGRITVETWDRAEVQYEAVVRPEADADHPEATKVRVDDEPDRFEIRTLYDESKEGEDESGWFGGSGQNMMPVTYTLTVPRTAQIEIEDHESEIRVDGGEGRTTIGTHDGTVTLTNRSGRADIDTHDAQIEADGLRGGLRVETHDGRGRFSFDALTDDVVIATHDGTFTLTLPAEAGFNLQTDFNDDVDLRADVDLSPYRIVDDDGDEVNYEGSVRGGGVRLSLTAHAVRASGGGWGLLRRASKYSVKYLLWDRSELKIPKIRHVISSMASRPTSGCLRREISPKPAETPLTSTFSRMQSSCSGWENDRNPNHTLDCTYANGRIAAANSSSASRQPPSS